MGISTKRLLKIHLYEPEADIGFWPVHVERIFCEKRRRRERKEREKKGGGKERKKTGKVQYRHRELQLNAFMLSLESSQRIYCS